LNSNWSTFGGALAQASSPLVWSVSAFAIEDFRRAENSPRRFVTNFFQVADD
jgi:hypothetical protein